VNWQRPLNQSSSDIIKQGIQLLQTEPSLLPLRPSPYPGVYRPRATPGHPSRSYCSLTGSA